MKKTNYMGYDPKDTHTLERTVPTINRTCQALIGYPLLYDSKDACAEANYACIGGEERAKEVGKKLRFITITIDDEDPEER